MLPVRAMDWGLASRTLWVPASAGPARACRRPGPWAIAGWLQQFPTLGLSVSHLTIRIEDYGDVANHADAILERLRNGSMPCDARWSADKVQASQQWVALAALGLACCPGLEIT